MNEAEIAYERAIKYGKAVELLAQIRAEWPFLGAWKVRRAATSGLKEVIKNAEFIVNFSSRVAKLDLRLDPSRSRERLTDASNSDFEREYEAVRQIFEQINREFKSVVDAQPTASSCAKSMSCFEYR